MIDLDRRQLLALGGALLLADAAAQESRAGKLTPPPPAKALPRSWLQAPSIPIWPDEPPGAAGFAPQTLPEDWSPVFLRNVARPDLKVFRPAQPNGQALLVVPGGAYWFVSVANEGAELAPHLTERGFTVFVLTYRLPGEGWLDRSDVPLQDAQRAMRVIRSRGRALRYRRRQSQRAGFLGRRAPRCHARDAARGIHLRSR